MKYLALSLAAIALVGTCGCGRHKVASSTQKAPAATSRAAVDHSDVNSLIEGMDRALQQKDYANVVACIQPEYRNAFGAMLKASAAYSKKMNEVAELLDERIDPAAAKRLRAEADQTFRSLVPSPLAGAVTDGKVDWGRVTIVPEATDQVAVKVDGLHTDFGGKFFIVYSGRQWFVRPMEDPDTFAKDVKGRNGLVDRYDKSLKALGKIEGRIKHGKITAQNVDAELWPKG